jgi:hypothetical protein
MFGDSRPALETAAGGVHPRRVGTPAAVLGVAPGCLVGGDVVVDRLSEWNRRRLVDSDRVLGDHRISTRPHLLSR